MNNLLLYHHLGLGDHIICNGMVRYFCNQYDSVTIFCKQHNFSSVYDMFCDLLNLNIVIGNDDFAQQFIAQHKNHFTTIKYIGFHNLNYTDQFEQQFYKIAGLDFNIKWQYFYIPPKKPISTPTLPHNYNFIHEDRPRNYIIDTKLIQNAYYNFYTTNITTSSIIDYLSIIKQAIEIHVIDSVFMFLIDCIPHKNQKLYIHRYSRQNPQWNLPILCKSWTILQ